MRHLSITILLLTLLAIFPNDSVSAATFGSEVHASAVQQGPAVVSVNKAMQRSDAAVSNATIPKISVHSGAIIEGRLGRTHCPATEVVLDESYPGSNSKAALEQIVLPTEKRNR